VNIVLIADALTANSMRRCLKEYLKNNSIDTASPFEGETSETFANRLLEKWSDKEILIILHANVRCGGGTRSSCAGLDVLEYILAKRAMPAIVLSFLDDPVQFSKSRRLKDTDGKVLISCPTVFYLRLPISDLSLVHHVRVASKWGQLNADQTKSFSAAFYWRRAAVIRHGLINLQAALRMLTGVAQMGLITQEEYGQVIADLKNSHPFEEAYLDELHQGTDSLKWRATSVTKALPVRKLLLVDDEAESSAWGTILRPICESIGAELDIATTPAQGENKLLDSWDAVILDLHYLNVDDPPDPFEVLSSARAANPFVPIIIFTTEEKGNYVRDLSKDSFRYFFKEMHMESAVETREYAESFRSVLQTALDESLLVVLRGMVSLLLPYDTEGAAGFERAHDLLEYATSSILRPEAALPLITGALMEAKVVVANSQKSVSLRQLMNLFAGTKPPARGLRVALPDLVIRQRNYASHYEAAQQPKPSLLDAVVYLLTVTQFVADLRTLVNRGSFSVVRPSDKPRLLEALGRVAQELRSILVSTNVLDSAVLDLVLNLETCSEEDLRSVLEERCAQWRQSINLLCRELTYYKEDEEKRLAFQRVIQIWFGLESTLQPVIDWQGGKSIAPYLLYVCSFLMLERVAQIDSSLIVTPVYT